MLFNLIKRKKEPKLIVDPLEKDLAQLIINAYKVKAEMNEYPSMDLECELSDIYRQIGEEVFHVSTINTWPVDVKHFHSTSC